MIIYFSGTGNSRYVAETLASHLDDNAVVELKGEMLYDPMNARLYADGGRVIWVFPTYSWGIPPAVSRFMKEATIDGAENAQHSMVTTCGDDTGETASQWRKLMKQRNWPTVFARTVIMPNTYVLMKGFDVDSQSVAEAKIAKAPLVIKEIADDIIGGKHADVLTKGSWPWIKSNVIYPYFVRFCMSPKPFRSNGRCIGCGKCASLCPMDNITMDGDRPRWHDRCALCLRCYHVCQCKAVEYGRATEGKGQYLKSKMQ